MTKPKRTVRERHFDCYSDPAYWQTADGRSVRIYSIGEVIHGTYEGTVECINWERDGTPSHNTHLPRLYLQSPLPTSAGRRKRP